jgi:hypothetical protein
MSSKIGTDEIAHLRVIFLDQGYDEDFSFKVDFNGNIDACIGTDVHRVPLESLEELHDDADAYFVVVGITGGRFGEELPLPLPPPGMRGRTPLLAPSQILEFLGIGEGTGVTGASSSTTSEAETVVETVQASDHVETQEGPIMATPPKEMILFEGGLPGKTFLSYRAHGVFNEIVNYVVPDHYEFNHNWSGPFDRGNPPFVKRPRLMLFKRQKPRPYG